MIAAFSFSAKSQNEISVDALELIGRLLFVTLFLHSGVRHLTKREGMAAYARGMGAPAADLLVPATGVMLLVGGTLVALGVWADLGALLIAAFLLPTAYFMHGFWRFDDEQARQQQQIHFMKNISLAGAALALVALYAQDANNLWMVTGPLL
jgi:putative oxidoreductase